MKTENEDEEVVTKGWFRSELQKELRKAFEEFAVLIGKSFQDIESRMAKQEDLIVLTTRVDNLEKYMENRFNDIDRQLDGIRAAIVAVDSRADVVDLQGRVSALEAEVMKRMKKQGRLKSA